MTSPLSNLTVLADVDGRGRMRALRPDDMIILPPPGGPTPDLIVRLADDPPPGAMLALRLEIGGLTFAACELPCADRETRVAVPGLLDAVPGRRADLIVELREGWERRAGRTVAVRCAPFVLASSLDPPVRVLVAATPLNEPLLTDLERAVTAAGAELTRVAAPGAPDCDLWLQDAAEIGWTCQPGGEARTAALAGLRGDEGGFDAAPLDERVADLLAADGALILRPGERRPGTRWADWYGNLEVSPPCPGYPLGRVLHGIRGDLTHHPAVLEFLAEQRLQWPPVAVDVSWLRIGHVDEVVQFVPDAAPPGFAVLMPSPDWATVVLDELIAAGHGDLAAGDTTVAALRELADTPEQALISAALRETRRQLAVELGLPDAWGRFIPVPLLFRDGAAAWPNLVNSLVLGGHVILPDPHGPVIDGRDAFLTPVSAALAELGLTVHVLDDTPYHQRGGDWHCGTNVIRRPTSADWWTLAEPAAAARLDRSPTGLERLGAWLSARADGLWEQSEGLELQSTDAPGWALRIPLRGSPAAGAELPPQRYDGPGESWARWWVERDEFHARCGPAMLEFVMRKFAEWGDDVGSQ